MTQAGRLPPSTCQLAWEGSPLALRQLSLPSGSLGGALVTVLVETYSSVTAPSSRKNDSMAALGLSHLPSSGGPAGS